MAYHVACTTPSLSLCTGYTHTYMAVRSDEHQQNKFTSYYALYDRVHTAHKKNICEANMHSAHTREVSLYSTRTKNVQRCHTRKMYAILSVPVLRRIVVRVFIVCF